MLPVGLVCALLSCSADNSIDAVGPKSGNETSKTTSLDFKFTPENMSDFSVRAESAVLKISGDGLETITQTLTLTDSSVEGSVNAVLAGENRNFTIQIFDEVGTVQYEGSTILDVTEGSLANLPILITRQYHGREGDSIALVALDKANATPFWDWSTPIDTWTYVEVGADPTDRVTMFFMDDNNFAPSYIPEEIGYLTELTRVGFSGSFSYLPTEFGKLTKLKDLHFYGTSLTVLPESFANLESLEVLSLTDGIFEEIPSVLDKLPNLSKLRLGYNQIKNVLELPEMANLETLELHNNEIVEITGSIQTLQKLNGLFLDNNKLSSLPSEIGTLTQLEQLSVRNNNLTDLPVELFDCSSLKTFKVSANDISSIPDEVVQLSMLGHMELENNSLSFGDLEKISFINYTTISPQDTLGEAQTITSSETVHMGVEISGSANSYLWTKDGNWFAVTDSILVTESGIYECKITSSVVETYSGSKSSLTMFHRPIAVTIADVTAPVLTNSPSIIVTSGEQRVRIAPESFDIIETVSDFYDVEVVVTELPTSGMLNIYDTPLTTIPEPIGLGAINDGDFLNYSHDGSENSSDSFKFKLRDKAGNLSEEYLYSISII